MTVTLRAPSPRQKILATDISDLVNFIYGVTGYGQRLQATQLSDAANFANLLGNSDTTNGKAAFIQYGPPSGVPVELASFQKSASRIISADGAHAVTVTNTGVNVTGGFLVSGQTIGAGEQLYNVLDYGITRSSGALDTTFAAANTTALQTLWATVGAAGGGTVYFPPGAFAFNGPVALNHGNAFGVGISMRGSGVTTSIHIFDATRAANGFVFGNSNTTSTGLLSRFKVSDLWFYQESVATNGATILFANVQNVLIERVNTLPGSNATAPGFTASN